MGRNPVHRSREWDPSGAADLQADTTDQTRGVPYFAPVIESLKQLDRCSEAELIAAVISAFFTVFIKNEAGDDANLGLADMGVQTAQPQVSVRASAVAAERTTCLHISHAGLAQALRIDPSVALNLLEGLSRRIAGLVDRGRALSSENVQSRLSRFILDRIGLQRTTTARRFFLWGGHSKRSRKSWELYGKL